MTDERKAMVAACGLECRTCLIRLVPEKGQAAEKAIAWYRKMGWLKEDEGITEALERKMYCNGCHGDRSVHWSADCWILKCCVDEKGLQHCSQCGDFVCDRLEKWAAGDKAYAGALARLKEMRGAEGPPDRGA